MKINQSTTNISNVQPTINKRHHVPTIPKKEKSVSENYFPTQNQNQDPDDDTCGFFKHKEQKIENQTPQPNTANERHVPIPKNNDTYELFNHGEKHEEQKIENQTPKPTNLRSRKQALTKASEEWRDMSQEERDAIGLDNFIKQHQLNPKTFHGNATPNGLKQEGAERLSKIRHNHNFNKPTSQDLNAWYNEYEKEQNNSDLHKFTAKKNLSAKNFRIYGNASKGITDIGKQLIQKDDGHPFNRVTSEILKEWRKLPQDVRNTEGISGFAKHYNVQIIHLRHYVYTKNKNPLSIQGKQLIQKDDGPPFNRVTKEVVQRWCNMSQEQRDNIGLPKFADDNNLYYLTLAHYTNQYGRNDCGERLLNKPDKTSKVKITSFKTPKNKLKLKLNIWDMMRLKKPK